MAGRIFDLQPLRSCFSFSELKNDSSKFQLKAARPKAFVYVAKIFVIDIKSSYIIRFAKAESSITWADSSALLNGSSIFKYCLWLFDLFCFKTPCHSPALRGSSRAICWQLCSPVTGWRCFFATLFAIVQKHRLDNLGWTPQWTGYHMLHTMLHLSQTKCLWSFTLEDYSKNGCCFEENLSWFFPDTSFREIFGSGLESWPFCPFSMICCLPIAPRKPKRSKSPRW